MSLDVEIREAERRLAALRARGGLPGPARFVLTVFYTEGLAWGVARTERRRIVIGVYTTLEKAQEKAVAYARVRPGLNAAKPGPTTRTGAPGKAATTGSRSSKRTTMDAEIREAERRLEALRARAGLSPKVYVLRTWRGGVTEILRVTTLFDGAVEFARRHSGEDLVWARLDDANWESESEHYLIEAFNLGPGPTPSGR